MTVPIRFSRFRLFRKRALWVPTWRLCLLLAFLALVLGVVAVSKLHGFLAVTEPVKEAEILVVEGWMADGALVQVVEKLASNPRYRYVCTTGIVIERGFYISEIKDYATLCGRSLEKLGVDAGRLVVCPTPPVKRNRTYESALALRAQLTTMGLLSNEGKGIAGIDVVSVGTHARRTRLNYRDAFGDGVPVGVVSIDWLDYDANRWWTSSSGMKQVVMESLSLAFEWIEGIARD